MTLRHSPSTALVVGFGTALAVWACGGRQSRVAALDDLERVRGAMTMRNDGDVAPEAHARAEQERDLALHAQASGDNLGTTLHAERAVAAYDHARAITRLARATLELADAEKSLRDATTEEQALEVSRIALERDASELEERVRIVRERRIAPSSSVSTPERAMARAVAARSSAMQARLLCAAAHLAVPDLPGLAAAESEVTSLGERLAKDARLAPIDDAARSRAHCLDVLTRARRTVGYDAGAVDALLDELSASGGWDPARDERGVAVLLRDSFRGTELTAGAAAKLADLGRVAAAHPTFAIQVVIHDSRAPAANDPSDAKRADAAVQALIHGGAAASRVRSDLAGPAVPLVDPSDTKGRFRNERMEVVFVL